MKTFKEILHEKVIKEHDPYTSKSGKFADDNTEDYDEYKHGEYDVKKPDHVLSTKYGSNNITVHYLKDKDGNTHHTVVDHDDGGVYHDQAFVHKGKINPKHIITSYNAVERENRKYDNDDY